jgi:uncharacterized membrane protein
MTGERTESSVVVDAPVEKIYDYWRTLENLPRFMSNIEEVRPTGPGRTHWVVKGPLGAKMEFDARTTLDEENSILAWNVVDGDGVETSGQARFRELGPGRTRVEVTVDYGGLPGGRVGEVGSGLAADPQAMLDRDLQKLKRIMEGAYEGPRPRQAPARPGRRRDGARPNLGAIALLDEWAADESGYDEEVLPGLKEALDRERGGQRKLFG